jgi:hypothetical protein
MGARRPTQLEVSPVLRGAYFTGVRAITVSDVGQLEGLDNVFGWSLDKRAKHTH